MYALVGFGLVAILMAVRAPSRATPEEALGPVADTTTIQGRAFSDNGDFPPLPTPGPQDWLTHHPEPGQTYDQFLKARFNTPDSKRNVIYIQPLAPFERSEAHSLVSLQRFTEAFFGMPVQFQQPLDTTALRIRERKNPYSHQRQFLSTDILRVLKKDLPDDAYCRLGITTVDLYPEASWNFVFGQASLRERTGVYSFARYDPAFYGEQPAEGDDRLVFLRSCKVLAHEAAHMFGLAHCIYYHCLMNGSNNLQETDASPIHLCPVCLRKLHSSLDFDIVARYQDLEKVYAQAGLETERIWVQQRIQYIASP